MTVGNKIYQIHCNREDWLISREDLKKIHTNTLIKGFTA